MVSSSSHLSHEALSASLERKAFLLVHIVRLSIWKLVSFVFVGHRADFYDFVGISEGFWTGIEDTVSLACGVGRGCSNTGVEILP